MTVKEFKEKLAGFPEDLEIGFGRCTSVPYLYMEVECDIPVEDICITENGEKRVMVVLDSMTVPVDKDDIARACSLIKGSKNKSK